jgi:hypothetical protein
VPRTKSWELPIMEISYTEVPAFTVKRLLAQSRRMTHQNVALLWEGNEKLWWKFRPAYLLTTATQFVLHDWLQLYTGWFRSKGQYARRWHYRSLYKKKKPVHMNMCLIVNDSLNL